MKKGKEESLTVLTPSVNVLQHSDQVSVSVGNSSEGTGGGKHTCSHPPGWQLTSHKTLASVETHATWKAPWLTCGPCTLISQPSEHWPRTKEDSSSPHCQGQLSPQSGFATLLCSQEKPIGGEGLGSPELYPQEQVSGLGVGWYQFQLIQGVGVVGWSCGCRKASFKNHPLLGFFCSYSYDTFRKTIWCNTVRFSLTTTFWLVFQAKKNSFLPGDKEDQAPGPIVFLLC